MTRRRRVGVALLVASLVLGLTVAVVAQRRQFFYGWDETVKNAPYDGRFTFARVRYRPAPGGNWAGGRPSWVHGYPLAERNLLQIMKEVSLLDANVDTANVVTLDDPELFTYPIAYIIEVGWWTLTDLEAAGLHHSATTATDLRSDSWPRSRLERPAQRRDQGKKIRRLRAHAGD